MGRSIGGAIAGYVVMFLVVFLLMSLAWMLLGASGSFQPGSWEVSRAWVAVTFVVGLLAAVAGGWACALIAKDPRGPKILIGLTIVLGVLFAIPVLTASAEAIAALGPRPDDVTMADAMTKAQQPAWLALVNPLLGAVGVWLGARLNPPPKA